MTAPKGHKVVTGERQGGYAARCTVVVNGVETLCDATFAFDTRTQAREAIRHEEAPGAVAAAVGGGDQHPTRGTIMTNDTSTTRWPVAREDGFDEVHLADDEHGVSAYVTHIDGEDFWRVELALQNAQALHSCKEDQVAAARLMAEAARCALELNGEQAAA